LTISRKPGDSIIIGDPANGDDFVVLLVREINRNSVRISIEAPRKVKIFRGEVYERLKASGELEKE